MRSAARIAAVSLLLGGVAQPAHAKLTDFTLKAINGKWNGKDIGLRTFKKKVIYMTFFTTWCRPCKTELKQLRRIYKKYKKKGLEIIAVSLDQPQTRSRVRPLVKRYKLKFPVVIDSSSQLQRLYNPKRAMPFSILISRERKVLKRRAAFQISDLPEIEDEIRNALK